MAAITDPLAENAASDRLISPNETIESLTRSVESLDLTPKRRFAFRLTILASFGMVGVFVIAVTYLFARGLGIFGNTIPAAWAFPIVNFVWWIGIGHAGTFISAILLLLHQEWRDSINRFAEAMTLFAVLCAALMPLVHLGRPILFYWLIPYPNTMNLWPQFRSPLVWDMFAIMTYGTISLLFFYIGLVPDLASFRDRARSRTAFFFYGILAGGWRGSARQWSALHTSYKILAGIATPLVVSVHSIVSLDFASAILPAWHSEIFPPYFVAGAIYSGFAMVLAISLILRACFSFGRFITQAHLDKMTIVMLSTGLVVAYAYLMEPFMSWYSGDVGELLVQKDRLSGEHAPLFWFMFFCNVLLPQILWFARVRRIGWILFGVSVLINVGMWLERFVIIVLGLNRDHLPALWRHFYPTFWDLALLFGLFGIFFFFMQLFVRFFPVIPMHELKTLVIREGKKERERESEGKTS